MIIEIILMTVCALAIAAGFVVRTIIAEKDIQIAELNKRINSQAETIEHARTNSLNQ